MFILTLGINVLTNAPEMMNNPIKMKIKLKFKTKKEKLLEKVNPKKVGLGMPGNPNGPFVKPVQLSTMA